MLQWDRIKTLNLSEDFNSSHNQRMEGKNKIILEDKKESRLNQQEVLALILKPPISHTVESGIIDIFPWRY